MRCSSTECVKTNCPYHHKCARCHGWKLPSAFGTKCSGKQRKACCMKCSENNAKNNAILR